jgi:hypothetical protein
MKLIHVLLLFAVMMFHPASAQPVPTGFPVLTFGPSPIDNGMGSLPTFRSEPDPFVVTQNPAYLGFPAHGFTLNGGFFSPRTQWLPGSTFYDFRFGTQTVSAGMDLAPSLELPITVGLGYSCVRLDLGDFVLTGPSPIPLATIAVHEMANDYSLGIGADLGIRLAAGFTLRHLETNISLIRTSTTNAYSVGFLSSFPVHALLPVITGTDEIFPSIRPTLDITAGLVFANYGDSINYGAGSDPLPRTISSGLSVELGITSTAVNGGLKIMTAALTRGARELLVTRDTSGQFHYVSGTGHLAFVKNVIQGIRSEPLVIAKGWEVSILEIFAVRGGSYNEGIPLSFETTGWSLRSAGLLKLLGALTQTDLLTSIGNRVDVRYDTSKEKNSDPDNPRDGTSYAALSVSIRF